MPFASARMPSIQLGLLKAIAERAGFPTDCHYLNLDLAAELGAKRYEALCEHRGHLTGEWLFSVAAFGEEASSDTEEYFRRFPEERDWALEVNMSDDYLAALRSDTLPEFIRTCRDSIDWGAYDVVGFSSMFQQNVSSLALAQALKAKFPHITIVFGGANMEDEMGGEVARAFPYVDYVVVGEGDAAFPALLAVLSGDGDVSGLRGVVYRSEQGTSPTRQAAPVVNLDSLPTPNYDDCYRHAADLGVILEALVPFESSRGCWWGEKHHCTFCGLNGLGMGYRVKTPARLMSELDELIRRHHITFFQATDNILDMKYIEDVFVAVADRRLDCSFFYEVKANLKREQLAMLYRGGLRSIQPGIESLSTHVLQLMRKGSTMLQNVRLLKWARYYGMRVAWNLICGFPGETAADYENQLRVLMLLSHLEPPNRFSRIWLERFAPYFAERETFPVHDVRPEASYELVYPAHVAKDKIAYFFDYEMEDTLPPSAHEATHRWIAEWRARWESKQRNTLSYRRAPDAVFVDDGRHDVRGVRTYVFEGHAGRVYEYCSDTMRTTGQIVQQLSHEDGRDFSEKEVSRALAEFCDAGLMVHDNGRYLSLALPVNPNW